MTSPDSEIRHKRYKEKFRQDRAHIKFLLSHGWHPLEIADQMTQFNIMMMREGIQKRHPEWTKEEVLAEMRRISLLNSRTHRRRK